MIHFFKKCLTVKPYYPKLEPHLSALRGKKKPETQKLMHVKLKLHVL